MLRHKFILLPSGNFERRSYEISMLAREETGPKVPPEHQRIHRLIAQERETQEMASQISNMRAHRIECSQKRRGVQLLYPIIYESIDLAHRRGRPKKLPQIIRKRGIVESMLTNHIDSARRRGILKKWPQLNRTRVIVESMLTNQSTRRTGEDN